MASADLTMNIRLDDDGRALLEELRRFERRSDELRKTLVATNLMRPTHAEQVLQFQRKLGQLVPDDGAFRPRHLSRRKMVERIECMEEELHELEAAVAGQSLEGQADALVDLVYFALGTANMLGLPWEELWQDVHRANMAKERGQKVRQGNIHRFDAVKPPGWRGPRTAEILAAAGYDEDRDRRVEHDDPAAEAAP